MDVTIQTTEWLDAPVLAERPCFAIGDVHGRDDLFAVLLAEIDRVIASDQLENAVVIGLGDYIDRGPAGIAALKRALDAKSEKYEFRTLPGNHEQFLAAVLMQRTYVVAEIYRWFRNGGGSIAQELGFAEPEEVFSRRDDFLVRLQSALGPDRIRHFLELPNHLRLGQYLFVHAGIHPRIGMSMLEKPWHDVPNTWEEEDLDPLWVRGPFLCHEGKHEGGVIVVHGHTPRDEVELMSNRINVDTRAYHSGRLTAVHLLDRKLRFISAHGMPYVAGGAG